MRRFFILQVVVLHSQRNTSVFPISEKRKQKQKSTFKSLQPDSEGKWSSAEKLKNALIASTDEFEGVIANKHSIW
jgi:uncharacterized protein HemY